MRKKPHPQYVISEKDKTRQANIQRAWKAYHDELELPLMPLEGEDEELANVASNIVAATVNSITSFLFGDSIEISIEGEDETKKEPSEEQKYLDEIWGKDETRLPLLQRLSQNGALSGQAFLRIVPKTDGSIRLIALDPHNVFVRTAPDDCETVQMYCIEYAIEEDHKDINKTLTTYKREEIVRQDPQKDDPDTLDSFKDKDTVWSISHWTKVGEESEWKQIGEPYIWPYSFSPVFGCQNLVHANEYWGIPECTKGLIALNKAINFVLSNINKVGKMYAQPILFAPGSGGGYLDIEIGRIIQLGSSESIQSVPIHSDLANQLAFLEKLYAVAERITSIPSIASGVTGAMPSGDISGVALRTRCIALLQKIEMKKHLYGKLLIDVSRAILHIKGKIPAPDVNLSWQEPLPTNTLEQLQAAMLKANIGFSTATILRELGADPDEEMEQARIEQEKAIDQASKGQRLPKDEEENEEEEEER
jgi:hypothetical protein